MRSSLALVMPVYNEEACIAGVVESWYGALSSLGMDFRMIILNDGSTDGTRAVLSRFAANDRIEIINKANSGHGPTILAGYRKAVNLSEWVFQCDSDDEIQPDHFSHLWEQRSGYDALFGVRDGRRQNLGRKIISACSRSAVRILFGDGVLDVNVPYRLIRADLLGQIIRRIPPQTFAPNVIISGALAGAGLRIYNYPVPCEGRKTGKVSITSRQLWRVAFGALWQTLNCHPVIPTSAGSTGMRLQDEVKGND